MSEKRDGVMEVVCSNCGRNKDGRPGCTSLDDVREYAECRGEYRTPRPAPAPVEKDERVESGQKACHRLMNNGIQLTTEDALDLEKIIRDLLAVVDEQRVENAMLVDGTAKVIKRCAKAEEKLDNSKMYEILYRAEMKSRENSDAEANLAFEAGLKLQQERDAVSDKREDGPCHREWILKGKLCNSIDSCSVDSRWNLCKYGKGYEQVSDPCHYKPKEGVSCASSTCNPHADGITWDTCPYGKGWKP